MTEKELNTEERIFNSACEVFLLYGYHGTTLHQIVIDAGVQKSAVHYYFRSKEKLYEKVVVHIIENIIKTDLNENFRQKSLEKERWFLTTEMYNNHTNFEKILKTVYPNDWEEKLKKIKLILQNYGGMTK